MGTFKFLGEVISGGRITIPKAYREKNDIESGDIVDVEIRIEEDEH